MLIKDIIGFLEEKAPLFLQEAYDNSGLQWGNPELDVKKYSYALTLLSVHLKLRQKKTQSL